MDFSILLNHVSILCWKNSYGSSRISVVTGFLTASTLSNQVPLMIPLSWGGGRKKLYGARSSELVRMFLYCNIFSGRSCRVLSTPSPVTFQRGPNLSWLSSKNCMFYAQPTFDHSTDDCHMPDALLTRRWPQFCLLNALSS